MFHYCFIYRIVLYGETVIYLVSIFYFSVNVKFLQGVEHSSLSLILDYVHYFVHWAKGVPFVNNKSKVLLVCGMWYVVCGMQYVVCGMWYAVCGMWYVVCGMWYVVCGMRYVVCGMQYVVCGMQYTLTIYKRWRRVKSCDCQELSLNCPTVNNPLY